MKKRPSKRRPPGSILVPKMVPKWSKIESFLLLLFATRFWGLRHPKKCLKLEAFWLKLEQNALCTVFSTEKVYIPKTELSHGGFAQNDKVDSCKNLENCENPDFFRKTIDRKPGMAKIPILVPFSAPKRLPFWNQTSIKKRPGKRVEKGPILYRFRVSF